jgi:hypothetical protein
MVYGGGCGISLEKCIFLNRDGLVEWSKEEFNAGEVS